MALVRENPRSVPEVEPGPGYVLEDKFVWSHHPSLEEILKTHMAEYYELWEQQLLPLHREGKVTVVPVLAEATLWESLPEIESMPVLPRNKKPLGSWDDDMPEAWRHVMTELSTILQNL